VIRPRPARWFEALVARDDCTVLLDALARTGAVELEARGKALPVVPRIEAGAGAFRARPRYGAYYCADPRPVAVSWPPDVTPRGTCTRLES
jgi:hypothetical protein